MHTWTNGRMHGRTGQNHYAPGHTKLDVGIKRNRNRKRETVLTTLKICCYQSISRVDGKCLQVKLQCHYVNKTDGGSRLLNKSTMHNTINTNLAL